MEADTADFPNSITAPEFLRPIIEAEIERLIGILDAMDPDPDLEPSLSFGMYIHLPNGVDLEGDNSDDEPCCEDEGAQCDGEGEREWI